MADRKPRDYRYRFSPRSLWAQCDMMTALATPYDDAQRLVEVGTLEIERRVDGKWVRIANINLDGLK